MLSGKIPDSFTNMKPVTSHPYLHIVRRPPQTQVLKGVRLELTSPHILEPFDRFLSHTDITHVEPTAPSTGTKVQYAYKDACRSVFESLFPY